MQSLSKSNLNSNQFPKSTMSNSHAQNSKIKSLTTWWFKWRSEKISPDFIKTQGCQPDVSSKQPSLSKSSAFLALVRGHFIKLDHGINVAQSQAPCPTVKS